jgi:hypothetical protein
VDGRLPFQQRLARLSAVNHRVLKIVVNRHVVGEPMLPLQRDASRLYFKWKGVHWRHANLDRVLSNNSIDAPIEWLLIEG